MPLSTKPPAIFLMGPTASGKTALAIELCQYLPCDLISVDSSLVYRGMNIGTAKPSADEQARAPHALIDIRDPADPYSAADFRRDALLLMAESTRKGRIPLLVGGTILYFKALAEGLADLPETDAQIRRNLAARAEQEGLTALHAELEKIDPLAADKIHPNNPQRLLRALEVYEQTGIPLGEHWQRQGQENPDSFPYDLHAFAIDVARPVLHQRIEQRFLQMLELGLVDEVTKLRARGDLNLMLPSMRAVGYRQVWEYLDGLYDYQSMVDKAVAATRQLAKRQFTWLRKWPDLIWLDSANAKKMLDHLKYLA